jgi:hypothetical protein
MTPDSLKRIGSWSRSDLLTVGRPFKACKTGRKVRCVALATPEWPRSGVATRHTGAVAAFFRALRRTPSPACTTRRSWRTWASGCCGGVTGAIPSPRHLSGKHESRRVGRRRKRNSHNYWQYKPPFPDWPFRGPNRLVRPQPGLLRNLQTLKAKPAAQPWKELDAQRCRCAAEAHGRGSWCLRCWIRKRRRSIHAGRAGFSPPKRAGGAWTYKPLTSRRAVNVRPAFPGQHTRR